MAGASMLRLSGKATGLAAVVVTGLGLAACDNEPAQRKSFMEFLQTRIIDKPGVHVPQLTPELESKLGNYSKHYALIANFHSGIDQSVGELFTRAARMGSVISVADVVSRRDDIVAVRKQIAELRTLLGDKLAAAETARANLVQPDDLKPVYEAAFERDVRATVNGFQKELPLYEDALQSMLKLADYLESHRDKISLQGPSIVAKDPKTLAEVNALLQDANKRAELIRDSQRRLSRIVYGTE